MSVPQALLGTIPGWITSAGVLGILGLVVRWQLGLKKIAVEAEQVEVNASIVGNAAEQNIRDHYAKEVARLTQKLDDQSKAFRSDVQAIEDRYRHLLDESEERHNACQKDRDILREEVTQLRRDYEGLIRVIAQASINKVLVLDADVPEPIRQAAERAQATLSRSGGGK